jgi:hypothetical protein
VQLPNLRQRCSVARTGQERHDEPLDPQGALCAATVRLGAAAIAPLASGAIGRLPRSARPIGVNAQMAEVSCAVLGAAEHAGPF